MKRFIARGVVTLLILPVFAVGGLSRPMAAQAVPQALPAADPCSLINNPVAKGVCEAGRTVLKHKSPPKPGPPASGAPSASPTDDGTSLAGKIASKLKGVIQSPVDLSAGLFINSFNDVAAKARLNAMNSVIDAYGSSRDPNTASTTFLTIYGFQALIGLVLFVIFFILACIIIPMFSPESMVHVPRAFVWSVGGIMFLPLAVHLYIVGCDDITQLIVGTKDAGGPSFNSSIRSLTGVDSGVDGLDQLASTVLTWIGYGVLHIEAVLRWFATYEVVFAGPLIFALYVTGKVGVMMSRLLISGLIALGALKPIVVAWLAGGLLLMVTLTKEYPTAQATAQVIIVFTGALLFLPLWPAAYMLVKRGFRELSIVSGRVEAEVDEATAPDPLDDAFEPPSTDDGLRTDDVAGTADDAAGSGSASIYDEDTSSEASPVIVDGDVVSEEAAESDDSGEPIEVPVAENIGTEDDESAMPSPDDATTPTADGKQPSGPEEAAPSEASGDDESGPATRRHKAAVGLKGTAVVLTATGLPEFGVIAGAAGVLIDDHSGAAEKGGAVSTLRKMMG